jgi:hypothetical protein
MNRGRLRCCCCCCCRRGLCGCDELRGRQRVLRARHWVLISHSWRHGVLLCHAAAHAQLLLQRARHGQPSVARGLQLRRWRWRRGERWRCCCLCWLCCCLLVLRAKSCGVGGRVVVVRCSRLARLLAFLRFC